MTSSAVYSRHWPALWPCLPSQYLIGCLSILSLVMFRLNPAVNVSSNKYRVCQSLMHRHPETVKTRYLCCVVCVVCVLPVVCVVCVCPGYLLSSGLTAVRSVAGRSSTD